MFRDFRLMFASSAFGVGYGIIFAVIGFLAAGAGHGTYVVIGLSSSPFGLAQDVLIGLIGAPVFWWLAAFLAGGARKTVWIASFLLLMSGHYLSLLRILREPSLFADWSDVRKVEGLFWLALVFYVLGQLTVWGLAFWQIRRRFHRAVDRGAGTVSLPPEPPRST